MTLRDESRAWPAPSDRMRLSELADGQADAQAVSLISARWREDEALRRQWHVYHLIGDVLRSEDLAASPGHDAAALAMLRDRLAREPVSMALAKERRTAGHRGGPSRWLWPVAAAAGLVAVVGSLVMLGAPPSASAPVLAETTPMPGTLRVVAGERGQVLRDARIDEYLQAHRATLAGSPAALPGGAMRNVELIVPAR